MVQEEKGALDVSNVWGLMIQLKMEARLLVVRMVVKEDAPSLMLSLEQENMARMDNLR